MDTLYPFSDTLTTTITAKNAFTYHVRIPSWVSKGTIAINGAAPKSVSPKNGLHAVSVKAGTTKVVLDLPSDITIGAYIPLFLSDMPRLMRFHPVLCITESRPHGSVAVHRGPLHYAYDISRSEKVLTANAQEPRAVDLEFDATGRWQYAIDPDTLTFHGSTPSGGKLPSPVFDSGLPPFTITATACPIDWQVAGDTFAAVPPTNPACTGEATNITLWPFGVSRPLPP